VGNFIREDDEISARELEERGFGKIAKGALSFASNFIRDEDGLAAREPEPLHAHEHFHNPMLENRELEERGFGKTLLKGVGSVVSNFIREDDELSARELEERGFGKIAKGALSFASNFIREDDELAARELEERSIGKTILKDVGKIVGNFIREEDELAARELGDDIYVYVLIPFTSECLLTFNSPSDESTFSMNSTKWVDANN
jgi:hypothetical protein